MSGQPAGAFDLYSISVEDASPINPPNIIGKGDTFTITINFKGIPSDPVYGGTWKGIRNLALPYEVIVYAEALGGGYEGTLAKKTGNLTAGVDNYTVTLTVPKGQPVSPPTAGALDEGLYLLGATVRILAFPQWVGFVQDLFVQVAPGAD